MTTTILRQAACALAVGALLVGCKSNNNNATDTTSAAGAVATGSDSTHRTDSATATTTNNNSGWTDGSIVAFTSAANSAEIEEGKLAETKATNAQVKAFARQMVADHQKMQTEGKEFATKNTIMPDTTKSGVTDLISESRDEYKDLQQKAKGADWDKDFIDKEIDGHQKVLKKLQDAEQATANPELKQMLTKAAGKVQEHLTKAQDIKQNVLKS